MPNPIASKSLRLSFLSVGSATRSNRGDEQLDLGLLVSAAPPSAGAMTSSRPPRSQYEAWVSWNQLSAFLGGACKKRWLEARVAEGMPSAIIAGKRVFRISKVVPWLRDRGHIEEWAK